MSKYDDLKSKLNKKGLLKKIKHLSIGISIGIIIFFILALIYSIAMKIHSSEMENIDLPFDILRDKITLIKENVNIFNSKLEEIETYTLKKKDQIELIDREIIKLEQKGIEIKELKKILEILKPSYQFHIEEFILGIVTSILGSFIIFLLTVKYQQSKNN